MHIFRVGSYQLTVLIALVSTASAMADNWTDIAPESLAYPGDQTQGTAWGDLNGDGYDDLILALGGNSGGPLKIYLNDGYGNMTETASAELGVERGIKAPILGDVDNDGDLDIFGLGYNSRSYLFRNNGDLEFSNIDHSGLLTSDGNLFIRGGAWADYDNDGDLDITTTVHTTSTIFNHRLYRNNGTGVLSDVSPSSFEYTSTGRGLAWADFDNDGDLDCYLTGGRGCPCNFDYIPPEWYLRMENRMLENVGSGVLVDRTTEVTLDVDSARGVAVGDYDNDGDLDIYICNWKIEGNIFPDPPPGPYGGFNKLLRNDGDFVFTDVTPDELVLYGGNRSCSWGDVDNDGDLDLMVMNVSVLEYGGSLLFENINSGESFAQLDFGDLNPSGTWDMSQTSCGFSDMDFDGDLDMFLACKGGFNRLMRNDRKNGNHWFKIELVGTESNRSAVGSRVTVTTNAQSQIREIQTGTGYWSQNSLTQHFGLGAASEIIEVKVRWPSGSIQTFHDVAVDQYVRLQECPLDCLCEGDINEDVDVNVSDLLEVIGSWGSCDDICPADLNLDGAVSVNDLLIVLEHWGPCWTLEPILGPAGRGLAPTPNSLPHPWRR